MCLLLDNNLCLLLDNNICLQWDYVFCWILPSRDIFYLIGILGSSTFNFHLVNRMHIICEPSVGDVGTLKTGYPRIQALSQDKEQDVHPRAVT
jgi:hypothetical protein